MNTKTIISIFIAFLFSFALVFFDAVSTNSNNDYNVNDVESSLKQVYRVYLEGRSIGLIHSKKTLENYIDTEQQAIKDKYQVNKVYVPNDLDIVKEYTYRDEVLTEKTIYEKIKQIKGTEAFTINGYEIHIEGLREETEEGTVEKEDVVIYVIDKSTFEDAVEVMIKAFVDSDKYEKYINSTQEEIIDTGSIIQNLHIENNISITEKKIPSGEKIYTSSGELAQILIFGYKNARTTYSIKEGDNIETVADANKMSPEEFLIANPNFKSKDDLLYPGQVVTLGILEPQFNIIEETKVVEQRSVDFNIKYEDDPNQYTGYEKVKQNGVKGSKMVTEIQQYVNGQLKKVIPLSEQEMTPAVDKIIVRGTMQKQTSSIVGGEVPVEIGSWVWPTLSNYYISSGFGWRWGKMHVGVDITGCGYGSPIYAANNGLVVESGYTSINGNYLIVKHSNNYFTMYAHLATRYKKAGDVVMGGDTIGLMGNSGFTTGGTGTHLHFQVSVGYPISANTKAFINPLKLY